MTVVTEPPVLTGTPAVLETARRVAAGWRTDARARDSSRRVPRDEIAALAASGLLGIRIPTIAGPDIASTQLLIDVLRVLAAADSSLAQVYLNHLGHNSVYDISATTLPAVIFDEIARGAVIGAWGVDRSRSNAGQVPTTIRRVDAGHLISADRYFCTGLLLSDYALVTGKDDTGRAVGLLVAVGTPGLQINDDWESIGQRNTVSGTSSWRDVLVPNEFSFPLNKSDPLRATLYKTQTQLFHTAIQVGLWDEAISVSAGGAVARRSAAHRAAAWALARRSAAKLDTLFGQPSITVDQAADAGIAVDETKSLAYVQANSQIAALRRDGGEQSVLERLWRNARVHSLHDPARWRQQFVGERHLNGTVPRYIPTPIPTLDRTEVP